MNKFDKYMDKFYEQKCPQCGKMCISYAQRNSATGLKLEIDDICPVCGTEILIHYNIISNIIRLFFYITIFILICVSYIISDLYFLDDLATYLILLNAIIRQVFYVPYSVIEIRDEITLFHYKRKRYIRLIAFCIAILVVFILYYNNTYLELSKGFYT